MSSFFAAFFFFTGAAPVAAAALPYERDQFRGGTVEARGGSSSGALVARARRAEPGRRRSNARARGART